MAKDRVRKVLRRFRIEEGDRPRLIWEKFSDTAREAHQLYACVYDPGANTIHMNDEFDVFEEVHDHFADKFPTLEDDKIRDAIHIVYGEDMQVRVMMAEGLADDADWDDDTLDRMLSPQVLTFAVMGLVAENNLIATKLGGLLG
jgi:hypothetical protein